MKVKRKRCICGQMAEVDEWNSKGVSMFCPECGGYTLDRDDLYEMALLHRMTLAFIERYRKSWVADAKNEDIGDEAYRAACEMCANMVDEMWECRLRTEEEWRDEKVEEVDYL